MRGTPRAGPTPRASSRPPHRPAAAAVGGVRPCASAREQAWPGVISTLRTTCTMRATMRCCDASPLVTLTSGQLAMRVPMRPGDVVWERCGAVVRLLLPSARARLKLRARRLAGSRPNAAGRGVRAEARGRGVALVAWMLGW